jgi:hypothetical protein
MAVQNGRAAPPRKRTAGDAAHGSPRVVEPDEQPTVRHRAVRPLLRGTAAWRER